MKIFKRGIAGLLAGVLVACGGGGGSFAGIDRLGVTSGTITGFGSIIVNGVPYEVNNQTAFDIDDSAGGGQADLQVGQQVTIQWNSTDDGVTRRSVSVSYDDTLEGPVAAGSIDLVNQSFVVLGQTVLIGAATLFDEDLLPQNLGGLDDGDFVEVSGLLEGNGAVRATRIELVTPNDDGLEVRGVIEGLDTLNENFVINGLTVDYSQVLSPPALVDGQFVEVEGDSFDSFTNTLVADKVELEDEGLPGDVGDDGEVEGFVTRFGSVTDFDVAGIPVTTNGQTVYEDGVAGNLALNVKVEVEGTVNATGGLVARKVKFDDGRVAADVTAVNTGAGTFTLAGVTVTVSAATRYEDKTGVVGENFGLDDISSGDYLEVRGTPGTGPTLTALRVERDDASDDGLLRGTANTLAGIPDFFVLGVRVVTNGSTEYRDTNDVVITSSAFFDALRFGTEVEVKFTQPGDPIVAREIELEDAL